MGWYEGRVWNWVFVWIRELTQEEFREVDELHRKIVNHNPVQNKKDTLLWNDMNCYTVKAFRATPKQRGII